MKVLIFDLIGKFGHFRKYYSNSSALSFGIPPRTTLCGLIAAILGWERDSYYNHMRMDCCKIGLACKAPIRKTIHKLNYLYIKNKNNLNASYGLPTQVPFELVSAPRFGQQNLRYRIYFSHTDLKIFNKLRHCLINQENAYTLSLGSANFHATYEWIGEAEATYQNGSTTAEVNITSAIPRDRIDDFLFEKNLEKVFVNELLPLDFNNQRELVSLKEMIYCEQGQSLFLKVKTPFYSIEIPPIGLCEDFVFME